MSSDGESSRCLTPIRISSGVSSGAQGQPRSGASTPRRPSPNNSKKSNKKKNPISVNIPTASSRASRSSSDHPNGSSGGGGGGGGGGSSSGSNLTARKKWEKVGNIRKACGKNKKQEKPDGYESLDNFSLFH